MQTVQPNTKRPLASQFRISRACSALAVLALACAPALGAPMRVKASQDPAEVSSFALDFAGFGGVASALIARTDFVLEVDTTAGTARFLRYDQDIDPLMLPGGISTGNIRVEVVAGSSTGSFNPANGVFVTNETYAIHFDGDLSAYGLTSPVHLPSTSTGVANVASESIGFVTMNWAGVSQLANPYDANAPIDFSYLCTLQASFQTNASTYIGLEMIPQVLGLGLPANVSSGLVAYLNAAIDAIAANNKPLALRNLNVFTTWVARLQGTTIPANAAQLLIASAKKAMALVRDGGLTLAQE